MILDRESDAYADAVLVAVLRYLVATKREELHVHGLEPADGVLCVGGVEIVDEIVRKSQQIALFTGERAGSVTQADEVYRDHRREIDPLWRYVEEIGLPALLIEARTRRGRSDMAASGSPTVARTSDGRAARESSGTG